MKSCSSTHQLFDAHNHDCVVVDVFRKKSHDNACSLYCVYAVGDEGKEEDRKRLQNHIKSGKLDYSMPVWKKSVLTVIFQHACHLYRMTLRT